jgi:hypothetical protein
VKVTSPENPSIAGLSVPSVHDEHVVSVNILKPPEVGDPDHHKVGEFEGVTPAVANEFVIGTGVGTSSVRNKLAQVGATIMFVGPTTGIDVGNPFSPDKPAIVSIEEIVIKANTLLHPRVGATAGFIVFRQKLSTFVLNGEGLGFIAPVVSVVGELLPKSTN